MKLLVGATNSGKTTNLLSRIITVLSENRANVLVVVPSMRVSDILYKGFAQVVTGMLPRKAKPIEITFPALYEKILRALGTRITLLDSIGRDRLLRKAIRELAAENALTYFDKTADKPGLVNSLSAFISELWRSGTDAERFAQVTRGRSSKDRDIALIFRRFQTVMDEAGATDAEGAGLLALQALKSLDASEVEKLKGIAAFVAADGFDYYSPVQVQLLARLGQIGIETAATLTYEDDRDVHLWQKPTRERFQEAGAEVIPCSRIADSTLSLIASSLLLDANDPLSEDFANLDVIKILSAPDRAAEVRAIAREIKRLILEDGFALDELTIVCRTLERYADQFERIFEECGIPLAIDFPLALDENACIIALLRLLRLAVDEFPRRSVLDSLRSPYFHLAAFDLSARDVDVIERLSFRERISQGRHQWQDAIASPDKIQGRDILSSEISDSEANSQLATKLDAFFTAVSFPKSAYRRVFAQQIKSLIENLQVVECLKPGETAAIDEIALQGFLRVLDALIVRETTQPVSLFSSANEGEITWTTFLFELERAIAVTPFDRPPDNVPAIVIQEAHNLRPRNYRAIFIAGLIEGEFPKRSPERSPYTLGEREELRCLGIDFTETTNDAGADLTQFYKAIAHAADKLFLSYARTELAGDELLKSYLVDELKSITGKDETRIAQMETENADDVASIVSFDELALMTARAGRSKMSGFEEPFHGNPLAGADRLLRKNLKSWRNTQRGTAIERRRLFGKERGIFSGFILKENVSRQIQFDFSEDYLWTASKINDYGNCPFKFFAKTVLNLSPLEEPGEGFSYDRLGSVYHEILEQTYATLNERGISLSEETIAEAAAIVEEASERIFLKFLESRRVRKSHLWEFETGEIKKNILNLLRAEIECNREQQAKPIAFEKSFGMGGAPPLMIENDFGKIKLCGIIDRIDETEAGLVVIDYKTSRTPVSPREAQAGRNLQLPIYLMAASQVLVNDKPVASGHYLHIHNGKKGSPYPNKQTTLEELEVQTESFIKRYVASVRRAEFPVEPKQANCYQRCPYLNLCRIQSLALPRNDE